MKMYKMEKTEEQDDDYYIFIELEVSNHLLFFVKLTTFSELG